LPLLFEKIPLVLVLQIELSDGELDEAGFIRFKSVPLHLQIPVNCSLVRGPIIGAVTAGLFRGQANATAKDVILIML